MINIRYVESLTDNRGGTASYFTAPPLHRRGRSTHSIRLPKVTLGGGDKPWMASSFDVPLLRGVERDLYISTYKVEDGAFLRITILHILQDQNRTMTQRE